MVALSWKNIWLITVVYSHSAYVFAAVPRQGCQGPLRPAAGMGHPSHDLTPRPHVLIPRSDPCSDPPRTHFVHPTSCLFLSVRR
ncbi:hypothetical protein C2E23DRAFT_332994 [Lenzites betulinus]|nr:hypothetical protein C2E23DRAFT_332994 [Lenzites betulinus]